MELLNTLISRHSVRTYNGEPLLSSDLEKILKAAKAAPVGLGLYDQMHLTVVNQCIQRFFSLYAVILC